MSFTGTANVPAQRRTSSSSVGSRAFPRTAAPRSSRSCPAPRSCCSPDLLQREAHLHLEARRLILELLPSEQLADRRKIAAAVRRGAVNFPEAERFGGQKQVDVQPVDLARAQKIPAVSEDVQDPVAIDVPEVAPAI